MQVYLDKVPARNRFKSESVPTMKGVKRCCASALAAIKCMCKTIIVVHMRPWINSKEDDRRKKKRRKKEKGSCSRRHHFSYGRTFKRTANMRLLWARDMIRVNAFIRKREKSRMLNARDLCY